MKLLLKVFLSVVSGFIFVSLFNMLSEVYAASVSASVAISWFLDIVTFSSLFYLIVFKQDKESK